MKITIDTQNLTIAIEEPIALNELVQELTKLLGDNLSNYKLIPVRKQDFFYVPSQDFKRPYEITCAPTTGNPVAVPSFTTSTSKHNVMINSKPLFANDADRELFWNTMINPPEPNDYLKQAFEDYKKTVTSLD